MRTALLFFAILNSFSAKAEDSTWSGRVFTDQYLYTASAVDSRLAESSLSAWLDWRKQFSESVSTHVIAEGNSFYRSPSQQNQFSFRGEFREAYASYASASIELKMGQQIIPWGKSDGVNPTDYFTAKNYLSLNPDDEVRRVGAPALYSIYTPNEGNSPFRFESVFMAYYPQMSLLIPDQSIPTSISFQKYPTAPGILQGNSMEYGLKASYLKTSYDFSLSFFQGYSTYPEYVFLTSSQSVIATHPHETAFGADTSFNWNDSIFRLESALHLLENGTKESPLFGLVEPSHWDSVVGIERSFLKDFRAQIQFLYRYHLDYQDPSLNKLSNPIYNLIQQKVASANALILNYQRQGNPGATFRLSYQRETSDWSGDLFLLGYFVAGQDYLFRPQVSYTPMTNWKLSLGADLYGGDPSRPLGALKSRSVAFFEAKTVF